MPQLSTTPTQSARQFAVEALSNYGVIDVANREQVLANRPDMVETLAALDHACDKLSRAEIADQQSTDLQQLRAATIAYCDMRTQRTGLAVGAAVGGMTGATFAQWLCCFAAIPRCPGCHLFVLGGAGHLCMAPSVDGLPCIGVGITVDRARGVVIIRNEHTLDVELPINETISNWGQRRATRFRYNLRVVLVPLPSLLGTAPWPAACELRGAVCPPPIPLRSTNSASVSTESAR